MSKKKYEHPCLRVREMRVRTMLAASFEVKGQAQSDDGTETYSNGSTTGWF